MIIYGKNVAKETLDNNKEITKVILSKEFSDKEIINKLQNKNIRIQYLPKFELDKITKENHQGIILYVKDYEYEVEQIIKNGG